MYFEKGPWSKITKILAINPEIHILSLKLKLEIKTNMMTHYDWIYVITHCSLLLQ